MSKSAEERFEEERLMEEARETGRRLAKPTSDLIKETIRAAKEREGEEKRNDEEE